MASPSLFKQALAGAGITRNAQKKKEKTEVIKLPAADLESDNAANTSNSNEISESKTNRKKTSHKTRDEKSAQESMLRSALFSAVRDGSSRKVLRKTSSNGEQKQLDPKNENYQNGLTLKQKELPSPSPPPPEDPKPNTVPDEPVPKLMNIRLKTTKKVTKSKVQKSIEKDKEQDYQKCDGASMPTLKQAKKRAIKTDSIPEVDIKKDEEKLNRKKKSTTELQQPEPCIEEKQEINRERLIFRRIRKHKPSTRIRAPTPDDHEEEDEEEEKNDLKKNRIAVLEAPVKQNDTPKKQYTRNSWHTPAKIRPPTTDKTMEEDESEPDEPLPLHSTPTKTPRLQQSLDRSIVIAPFFTKAYAFSNHFKCFFYVDKKRFCCTEQFYMYYKARAFGDIQSAREIMQHTEARDMKRIGSRIRNFNTEKWRKISILVMTIGNFAKYSQNPKLRKWLFETGDSILVEASPDDIYWGVGVRVDSASIRDVKNWLGKNVLGRILTRIRDVLKSKPEFQQEWEAIRRKTI